MKTVKMTNEEYKEFLAFKKKRDTKTEALRLNLRATVYCLNNLSDLLLRAVRYDGINKETITVKDEELLKQAVIFADEQYC